MHDCYCEEIIPELTSRHIKEAINPFKNRDKKKLKNYNPEEAEKDLSKRLSGVLRHRAQAMKLPIRCDGFLELELLLSRHEFRNTNEEEVKWVVMNSDKKRFEIKIFDGKEYIRAVQGHSMSIVKTDELLEEIHDPSEIPVCIHGTYKRFLDSIIREGLDRRSRNHIHFAVDRPGGKVISGSRLNVEVLIFIDVEKAMNNGITFYRSTNNVILSEGPIKADFFKHIEEL